MINYDVARKVYFRGIIEKAELIYFDPRTKPNKNGLLVVRPFIYYVCSYRYVCPICGRLHKSRSVGWRIKTKCASNSIIRPTYILLVAPFEDDFEFIDLFNR